jgi:2-polyprenyl-6-methoxyphenol hydroxylase-like FAD-dependent oxidoreductase
MKVLISGASIAGPALAYWLGRYGFQPTVVEIAPALRTGGSAVDFRGETHLGVLERMDILSALREIQTGGTVMRFVDETGRTLMEMPADFAGGDIEVPRFDLSRALYEKSRDDAEYLFGDSIRELAETPDGVDVTFERGGRRTFDLVIGADGVHSAVRRLIFGEESTFISHLGYYVASWSLPNDSLPNDSVPNDSVPNDSLPKDFGLSDNLSSHGGRQRESLIYSVPGRAASVGRDDRDPTMAGTFFVFASPELDYDRHDLEQQRRIIRRQFAGLGWQVPKLLAGLDEASDVYFDAICRVDITPWSRGRVALVGDAAAGATIGGMGCGTAIVAAYVLAGELARAGGDHTVAYRRYEELVRDFARRCQKGGASTGRFFAPPSALAIRLRNGLLNRKFLMDGMLRMARDRTNSIDLPDYRALEQAPFHWGFPSRSAPSALGATSVDVEMFASMQGTDRNKGG